MKGIRGLETSRSLRTGKAIRVGLGLVVRDANGGGADKVILVVEDWEIDRICIVEQLRSGLDAEVVVAGDGLVALQAIERQKPDLVVTDLTMPRMDGLKLVEHIRQRYSSIGFRQQERLRSYWRGTRSSFRLDNDRTMISVLVNHLQQQASSMRGLDDTQCTAILNSATSCGKTTLGASRPRWRKSTTCPGPTTTLWRKPGVGKIRTASGVEWLLYCHNRFERSGGRLVIHSPKTKVMQLLRIMRMPISRPGSRGKSGGFRRASDRPATHPTASGHRVVKDRSAMSWYRLQADGRNVFRWLGHAVCFQTTVTLIRTCCFWQAFFWHPSQENTGLLRFW
jgi:CheY-like chemotaxis protein